MFESKKTTSAMLVAVMLLMVISLPTQAAKVTFQHEAPSAGSV